VVRGCRERRQGGIGAAQSTQGISLDAFGDR
jgi:hypothetical protein